MMYIAAFFLQ